MPTRPKDPFTESALRRILKFPHDYNWSIRIEELCKMRRSFDVIVEARRKTDGRLDGSVKLSDLKKKHESITLAAELNSTALQEALRNGDFEPSDEPDPQGL